MNEEQVQHFEDKINRLRQRNQELSGKLLELQEQMTNTPDPNATVNYLVKRLGTLETQIQHVAAPTNPVVPFRPSPPPEFSGGNTKPKVEEWLFMLENTSN